MIVAVVLGGSPASVVQAQETRAQELKVGTWSGTVTQGNQNRNTRPASLEVKMVPDPHWRWRAGPKELLSVTFVTQGGSYELSDIRLEGGTLAYSFTFPLRGEKVNCELKRQADGSYEGDCAGGSYRRRVALTPPTDSPEPAKDKPLVR